MFIYRSDVALAPLTQEHAANMYRWMNDPAVRCGIGLRTEPSPEGTLAWIDRARQDASMRPFAVLLDGRHVGNVVLDRIDTHLATARLSVYVGEPQARHSGVGLTAIYLALREGFERYGLHKIWLIVHAHNAGAIRIYRRLGFEEEGRLRDEFWLDGRRVDALYMGLLVDDFRQFATAAIRGPSGTEVAVP
jgi:RimJ/RimL family protein N-acetyltransferase